jgi:hypothetical protein
MPPIAKDHDEANAMYQAMTDDEKAAVIDLIEGGHLDPVKATNTVAMRMDPAREKNSAWDSARTAAARFATLGLDDNFAGFGAAGGAGAQTLLDGRMAGEGVGDFLGRVGRVAGASYDEGRNERRAEVENAYLDNPNAYRAGAVVGTVGTMGLGTGLQAAKGATLGAKVARGAAVAAPLGAVSSYGLGDSDTWAGAGKDAATGAAIGGALGALAPLAPLVVPKAREFARQVLEKGGQNADELRVLTTSGATGGSIAAPRVLREAERVPGGVEEMARVMRDSGISPGATLWAPWKGLTTTSGVAKRAAKVMDDSGAMVGHFIDEATVRGGKVDANALAQRLRQAAADVLDAGGSVADSGPRQADALQAYADRIVELARRRGQGGFITPKDAKSISMSIGDDAADAYRAAAAGHPVSGRGEAMMTVRRAAEDALDPAFKELGLDPAAYGAAKRANQVSRVASDATTMSLGRASKNNLLGLTDAVLATSSPAAALAWKALGPFAASARASAAELSRELAKRIPNVDPRVLQKLTWLGQVAASGQSELGAAVQALEGEPAVMRALADLEAAQARQEQRRQALEGLSAQ